MPGSKGGKGGGTRQPGRAAAVRVKTARQRSASSTRWLQRQLNDPYVQEARRRGYRSRAVFKIEELEAKFKLLRRGMRVVDLGAAPGGWTQYAAEKVGPSGKVVALDLLEMDPVPGAVVLRGDLTDPAVEAQLRDVLGGPADLVLSDMAPSMTGHAPTDHLRSVGLAEAAVDLAAAVLLPGGGFVAKVLQGSDEPALTAALRKRFAKVARIKPAASRDESREFYLVATGFRGDPEGQA
ncbi:MAG: RlmE family RNA methyltransferase [Alphaproteobacteria bacterium]